MNTVKRIGFFRGLRVTCGFKPYFYLLMMELFAWLALQVIIIIRIYLDSDLEVQKSIHGELTSRKISVVSNFTIIMNTNCKEHTTIDSHLNRLLLHTTTIFHWPNCVWQ